ncbi:MAG TPA: hypothetical protein VG983_05065 [Caulobacterales bacterium]|nr:hypothetical protein [Caulobacterales bacterium]
MKVRLVLAALLLAPLAASCGLKKDLDRPPPLWGAERQKYEAEMARQKAEAEAKAKETPAQPGANVPTPPPPNAPLPSNPLDAPRLP